MWLLTPCKAHPPTAPRENFGENTAVISAVLLSCFYALFSKS